MKLEDIKAKLKEAGVDDSTISAVEGLDNSADVERLKGELEAEQGKAKGILEDKKRYKAERDTAKASLDKIETDKLPEADKHAKALKDMQERLDKQVADGLQRDADLAKAARSAKLSDFTGQIDWVPDAKKSAKLIIRDAFAEIDDLSDQAKIDEVLNGVRESNKPFITAQVPAGSGGKGGGGGGGSGGDKKVYTLGDSVDDAWKK